MSCGLPQYQRQTHYKVTVTEEQKEKGEDRVCFQGVKMQNFRTLMCLVCNSISKAEHKVTHVQETVLL